MRLIPLLIGSEPAAPLFCTKNCTERFCIDDAIRVIGLHMSFLGIRKSLGHMDLWFNNKIAQPECGPLGITQLNIPCNHNIVITYMAVTLLREYVFHAVRIAPKTTCLPSLPFSEFCPSNKDNCIIVDDSVIFDKNSTVTGDYCVSTLKDYPYCEMNDGNCKAVNATL